VATDARTPRRAGTPDLYALLGVGATATTDEIAAAFREQAKGLHPDRTPDDPATAERFKELSEAYATLTKPERRARYDAQRRQHTPAPADPPPSRTQQFLATPGRARAAVIGGIVCLLLGAAVSPVLLSLDTSPDTVGRDVLLERLGAHHVQELLARPVLHVGRAVVDVDLAVAAVHDRT
jgi:hypothetical protein